jgi:hypothetical protein
MTAKAKTKAAKRSRRGWMRGLSLAAVVAAIGLLVNLTSLADWIGHKLDPPSPPKIDTRLLEGRLSREHVPLADYLRDTGQPLSGLSAAERREPGLEFTVRVRFEGVEGRRFPLVWTLYDVAHRRPVSAELYRQEAAVFEPKSSNHARRWTIWVPYASRPGRYRLDLVLLDEKRQPVDELSTDAFRLDEIPSVSDRAGATD